MKKWIALMLGMALLWGGVAVTLRHRRQHRREPMFNRAPGLRKGIAPEFAAFLSAPTIPAVDPEDMRRVWTLVKDLGEDKPNTGDTGITGIDMAVLAEHCSKGANVLAVFTRVQLVRALLQQGLLDAWKEGDSLRPQVFEVIAKCALAPGGEDGLKFDTEAILKALGKANN